MTASGAPPEVGLTALVVDSEGHTRGARGCVAGAATATSGKLPLAEGGATASAAPAAEETAPAAPAAVEQAAATVASGPGHPWHAGCTRAASVGIWRRARPAGATGDQGAPLAASAGEEARATGVAPDGGAARPVAPALVRATPAAGGNYKSRIGTGAQDPRLAGVFVPWHHGAGPHVRGAASTTPAAVATAAAPTTTVEPALEPVPLPPTST